KSVRRIRRRNLLVLAQRICQIIYTTHAHDFLRKKLLPSTMGLCASGLSSEEREAMERSKALDKQLKED
ncbi:unnamed protein product, partial [Adineta ricciae]